MSDPTRPLASRITDWFAEAEDAGRWRAWWQGDSPSVRSARAGFAGLAAALRGAGPAESADWAGLVRTASEALLAALADDFPDDPTAQQDCSSVLLAALNRELANCRAPVRCGLVFPGSRFDPDTMESVETLSGNRLVVHRVVSWMVRDVSQPGPRIAARAIVVTE